MWYFVWFARRNGALVLAFVALSAVLFWLSWAWFLVSAAVMVAHVRYEYASQQMLYARAQRQAMRLGMVDADRVLDEATAADSTLRRRRRGEPSRDVASATSAFDPPEQCPTPSGTPS